MTWFPQNKHREGRIQTLIQQLTIFCIHNFILGLQRNKVPSFTIILPHLIRRYITAALGTDCKITNNTLQGNYQENTWYDHQHCTIKEFCRNMTFAAELRKWMVLNKLSPSWWWLSSPSSCQALRHVACYGFMQFLFGLGLYAIISFGILLFSILPICWRWQPSGTLRRIGSQKLTDVSEVRTASIIRVMMEAVSTSEMSVNFYQTTRRSVPEGCHLYTHRRDNVKSHL
jgi:hypothetical protein